MIRFIPQPLLRSVAPAASIALVLFALCLTSFAQAQSEAGPSRSTGTITVGAYVYSGPGFLSPVVRKAIRGESVTILGNNPSGTWLQIGDAEWIAALLVKVDADEASAETTPVIIKTPITVTRLTVKQIAPKQLITNPITTIAITGTKIATATAITDGAEITGTLVTTGGKVLTLGALLKKESTALSVGDLISNTAILSRQTISTTVISTTVIVSDSLKAGIVNAESDSTLLTPPEPVAFTLSPAYASRSANLRAGPGTDFAISGGVAAGEALEVTGRNEEGSWYTLASGDWIAAFLVIDIPPVTETPTAESVDSTSADSVATDASEPETGDESTEAPPTAEAPSEGGPEFVITEKRLWDVDENGGYLDGPSVHCGFKRELHVHVLDRNGNRMNGAAAQVVYGAKEIMITGSQGIGDGIASFVLGKGQDVKVVRTPDGREVSSETATSLVTESQYIPFETLIAARYCQDEASCRSFVDGNGCFGHFSWTVFFQQQ